MAGRSEVSDLAAGYGLLSGATRVGILAALASGPKNIATLSEALGASEQMISHHLGLLCLGGLVIRTRKGKSTQYATDAARMKALAAGVAARTPKK